MKLYIWTNFCRDYTPGLAFAIAKDETDARKQVVKKFGGEPYEWGDLEVRRVDQRAARYVCGGG